MLFRPPTAALAGLLSLWLIGCDEMRSEDAGAGDSGLPCGPADDPDSDSICSAEEGAADVDNDGAPNSVDVDSDGDGVSDALEAGDALYETPPAHCAREVLGSDDVPDFVDTDSDNDGLGDAQEAELGTDRCNIDSDGDGLDDLVEGAYERYNCARGIDCGCATDASCQIPPEHFYVVLPYGEAPIARDLEFGTTIRMADVFFLIDTTESMGSTLDAVKRTVSTSASGLIDRIAATIPDAFFGAGEHRDFPLGAYGGPSDEAFRLAIPMTPATRASDVQAALDLLEPAGGADGPEAQSEALYQIFTGAGGSWTQGSSPPPCASAPARRSTPSGPTTSTG